MSKTLRILLIEDSEEDAVLLLRYLQRGGYEPVVLRVQTADAMEEALQKEPWDLVLSDYSLPQFSAPAALQVLKKSGHDIPFIIITGSQGEETAVATMKAGAHDFILKGTLSRLAPAIDRELRDAYERRKRKRAEEKIEYLAYHDPLTGHPNRLRLEELLQAAIAASGPQNRSVGLMVMNLSRFREINNALGHHFGDLILKEIGPRLKRVLDENCSIARLSGNHFALLLPSLEDVETATKTAGRILKTLEEPFIIQSLSLEISASIGIALYPEHGSDADLLIRRADMAMFMAKETDSGWATYDPAREELSAKSLILVSELRHAIERGELFLVFQPKVALQTGKVIGAEALVRWKHPERGIVPPDQFIGLAEQTGLIKPLSLWVLEAALKQSKSWNQAGFELPVAVNLSVRNLQDPKLADQITNLMVRHGAEPGWLDLEITESVIMADPARAMETITGLRRMGLRLAIDDFGTGYSSLAYLRKLPADVIKIDKSFIKHIPDQPGDMAIVRATIDIAHHLGRSVVAEGVENQAAWDCLIQLGCDAAQGYYISRPISASDFTVWLKETASQRGWPARPASYPER